MVQEMCHFKSTSKHYMKDFDLTKCDLSFCRPPKAEEMKAKKSSKLHFFGHFKERIPQENFSIISKSPRTISGPL